VGSVLGGWQVSSVLNFRTGEPLRITQASGIGNSRPDYNGGNQVFDNWTDTMQYLDRSAYTLVENLRLRATIRPGNRTPLRCRDPAAGVDMTIAKAFTLRRQVRFESFNVPLAAIQPRIPVTSPTFGQITAWRRRTGQIGPTAFDRGSMSFRQAAFAPGDVMRSRSSCAHRPRRVCFI
jgi:hypothetical protein